jgi:hypothetical protein
MTEMMSAWHQPGLRSCRALFPQVVHCEIIPSAVYPPAKEAGQAARVQLEPLLERSGRGRPGLLGSPGSMAGGMISRTQPGARAPPPEASWLRSMSPFDP